MHSVYNFVVILTVTRSNIGGQKYNHYSTISYQVADGLICSKIPEITLN